MRVAPGSAYMRSSPSPPQDAHLFRGKTLTPESPKPLHYPSPSNIPILEKQMDPMLGEPALSIGTPASYQYPQQTQTPSAHSSTSYYADSSHTHTLQNAPAAASVGAPGYAQQPAYNAAQAQDTTAMQTFSQQPPAASSSDASHAPAQDSRPAYPYAHDANAYPPQQAQAPSPNLTVDVQALLDQLSTPANAAASSQYAPPPVPAQPTQQGASASASTLPAAPHLPPRPPPQEKPTTHPNYNPNDDIRSFHPHSSHRGSTQSQPSNIRSTIAAASASTSDKPVPRAAMSPGAAGPSPSSYGQRPAEHSRSASTGDDEDSRWPPEVNRMYEDFLEEERVFVTDGKWDQFPMGSRLFIGNLPTEKVTKRDIFHRFFRHGQLAQISIKQAYGFVQFLDAGACAKALAAEQGQQVRGRKMHLEISKPQRNTKKAEPERNAGGRRRSRSPDYNRGGAGPGRNDQYSRNSNPLSPRENRRFRDDYRPTRSPSPRRGQSYRARDRSPARYDRRRSRSRSPRRYRSPSPRRAASPELPLPFRAPQDVPDVQVLVLDEGLPRDFIRWVEETFQRAGLRIDVLIMSPRLHESAVVRRQIMEGVLAIIRLDTAAMTKSKIDVQIFDRRGGDNNVQFNEYAGLDPPIAAALVADSKKKAAPQQQPAPPSYGQPPYIAPAANPFAASTATPANLSNLISSLDPNSLSQLLGAMSGNGAVPQAAPAGISPDLARLLGSVATPAAAPVYNNQPVPQQQYAPSYQNPQFAPQPNGQQQTAAPPVQAPQGATNQTPDMAEIMAQLARYQR